MSNASRSAAPSRRDFLTLVSSAASLALIPNPLHALIRSQDAETAFRWERLSNDVRVAYGSGGNSLAVIRGRDALLIDTKVAGFGQVLVHELQSFGATARTVINTHHHGDHSGGNDAFTATADVVAQSRAKPRAVKSAQDSLERLKGAKVDQYAAALRESGFDVRTTKLVQRDVEQFIASLDRIKPESFAPTTTVDVEREIRAVGTTVQLKHVTPSHTDNDLIVYLPELDLLHAGDLLFNEHHTFVDVSAGASTRGWDQSLAAAIAMCKPTTRVIAGHGPVTDRGGLQRQRDYFDRLREAATAAIKEGKSRAEVTALKPAAVANLEWPALLADTLGVIYDELSVKRS